jgi:hypothetical protein
MVVVSPRTKTSLWMVREDGVAEMREAGRR